MYIQNYLFIVEVQRLKMKKETAHKFAVLSTISKERGFLKPNPYQGVVSKVSIINFVSRISFLTFCLSRQNNFD